ncbi:MAG: ATP-binding protein [Actinomycetota bacterium]|nr:ATP-binding protein [Actinomycetota bacterium]
MSAYKSATDSGEFHLEPDVTCLVGKNESGKTAVLEAMYRVAPLPTGHAETFEELRDYPRRYRLREQNEIPEKKVVALTFELDDDDIDAVEAEFGPGVIADRTFTVTKDYTNRRTWTIDVDRVALMLSLVDEAGIDATYTDGARTEGELIQKLHAVKNPPEAVKALVSDLERRDVNKELTQFVAELLPGFLYFDDYSTMPGVVSIRKLQSVEESALEQGERTALALLRLARVESKEFTEEDYEPRKAALEAAANQLTDEVFEYWSQNRDLSVELDIEFRRDDPSAPEPFLQVRIRNHRHRVSLNFSERSAGFVWFFSFLTAFSEFRDSVEPIVLLLDEPGLGLHAAAQEDLLRFIDEKLAPTHQVIYTTHSPFMVQATKLHRARTVEDVDDEGTKVRDDARGSPDTVFPLQAAMGYELAQTLRLGPDTLIVGGPADLIYLQIISDYAQSKGMSYLDDRWVIVPAGGLEKVATFISLIGAQLNVVALVDVDGAGSQTIGDLVTRGIIEQKRIIPMTEFTRSKEADLEDLLDEVFYLQLLRASGTASVRAVDFKAASRIVGRVEEASEGSFSRFKPAEYLLRNQDELLPRLSGDALGRFVALFERANQLLS